MPMRKTRLLILAVFLATPLVLDAQGDVAPEPQPYINVTVELNGLAESAEMLKAAVAELSATVSALAASPDDLTPEQLAAFTELTQQMNVLVVSLDNTIQGVGPAIRDIEAPTREVLVSLIDTARAEAIEPTLESVDRRIRNWVLLSIVGALVVVGFTGLGLFVSTRQLRLMAGMLRSIADDYEIVPKQSLEPVVASEVSPDQQAAADSEAPPRA